MSLTRGGMLGILGEILQIAETVEHPACKQIVSDLKPLLEKFRGASSYLELHALSLGISSLAERAQAVLDETKRRELQSAN